MLIKRETLDAIAETFLNTEGELDNKLLLALQAGHDMSGDKRGHRSTALLVSSFEPKLYHDLRVDKHPNPIFELRNIYNLAVKLQSMD